MRKACGHAGCLCKALLREKGAIHELEIRSVIKYFCMKGIPPKEIHEDFMETLGKESPSVSTVKKWAAELQRAKEREC